MKILSLAKTQLFQVSLTQYNCINGKPNIMVLNDFFFLNKLNSFGESFFCVQNVDTLVN